MKTYSIRRNRICDSGTQNTTTPSSGDGGKQQPYNRRSNTMNAVTRLKPALRGGIVLFLALLFTTFLANAQDIVIDNSSSFHGHGKYNVKGNIDNLLSTHAADTIRGSVHLVGTAAESLGMPAKGGLVFDTLSVDTTNVTGAKIANVTITTDSSLAINKGAFSLNNHVLNVLGSATKGTGTLVANGASDTVNYAGNNNQTVIGATYTQLNLANNGAKNLSDTVTATRLSHSGGALTVDNPLSVTATAKIGRLAQVASGKQLTLGTKSTIDTVVGNAGTIAGGTDSTLFGRTNNNGNIIGGAGSMVFNDTLNHNNDTIRAGSGGVVFKSKPIISAGGIVATTAGALNFQTDIQNNGTISVNNTGTAQFNGAFTAVGTLKFDSTSTATYSAPAGTQTVATATYGNLVLSNSDKNAADSVVAKGNLVLNKNLVMPTGKALILASAVGRNVSGAGEVVGTVKRTDPFTKDSLYTYNSANVAIALDSTVNGGNAQLTMLPDSNVTNPSFSRYAKRHYTFASNGLGSAKIKAMSLIYTDTELVAGLNPGKLGVRDYNGSAWSKVSSPTGYVRNVDTTNHVVFVDSVFSSLAGVQEFALVNVAFGTRATGAWEAPATWDEGSVPGFGDDAEINNPGITAIAANDSANSVTINGTNDLTIKGGGALTIATTFLNAGTLTVGNGVSTGLLTLSSDLTNNKQVIVTPLGKIAVKGKLKNFGDVTNDGIIDIGQ